MNARTQRTRDNHPAMWRRIRPQCKWAANNIDLDDHAAYVIQTIVRNRKRR